MSSTTRKKKPSAFRDFPLGCGRFAPRMTREELSAVRDFPEDCGRNAAATTKKDLEESTEVDKTRQEGDADARTAGAGFDSALSKATLKVAGLDDTVEKLTSLNVEVNNEKIDAMPLESEAKPNAVKESIDKLEDNQLLPDINVDDNTEPSKLVASEIKNDRNKDSEEDITPSETTLSKSKTDTSKDSRKESMQVKSMPKQPASKAKVDKKRDDKDIVPLKSQAKQPATKKKVDSESDKGENIMASKQSASKATIEKKRDGKGNAKPLKQEAKQMGQKKKSVKKGDAVGDISPLESKEAKEKSGRKNDAEDDVVDDSAEPDHADSESTPTKLNIKEGDKPESANDKNSTASAEKSSIKRKKTPASTANRRKSSGKKAKVFRSGDGDDNLDAGSSRNEVRMTLMMYDALRRHYVLEDEESKQAGKRAGGGVKRPDVEAGSRMMDKGLWLNRDRKVVGDLPGVQPGDIFYFRLEMCAIGLHSQVQAGIHYIGANNSEWKDSVAVSIIASGGYEDDEDDGGETLVYTGSGGNSKTDGKQNDDQKLERGNLALERSMHHGVEIRVIRGKKDSRSASGKIYIYDGLYKVEDYWLDKGKSGFGVFKYRLQRLPGQPELSSDILKSAIKWKSNPSLRQGLISSDISSKRENTPVYLVNTVDEDKGPEQFEYISEVKVPKSVLDCVPSNSCDCKGSCAPGGKCSCFSLNGGQMPYTHNGFLVKWRPMVYECSELCSCPPTCRNRLTQKGLKFHLEVFKTENRGWGVRSWDPIPAGAFICEYVGEVLSSEDIDQQVEENEFLLYAKRALEHSTDWGDVSNILPEKNQEDTVQAPPPLTFAINAKNLGNVSRFINHSCSPNVLLQSVLNDHHNTQFPHIMLFAMEHIPPLTELTFDYGVIDSGEDKSYVKA
ncbi:hypothetical protein SUGI_0941460 [Cryptomeria japonica]|uniref:histone-lysine N-methyltransferase family member SUVH9 n=1 Tax=Cryptomeria japonica TaxID=3369 RepID=UPI002414CEE9|nr:histone-lysine N-methyltransferase family member SUVH9 [Cryptomeria japonica]GLJ44763.1 hypothetical protein SUGI_0941460 [Cryptomeria japonica]